MEIQDYGIPEDILEKLKPFLSGMSLSDMDILLSRISRNTFEEFEDYISECARNNFKVFFDINRETLFNYMTRR